jgi:ABC-type multidrug transport system fused ATPase/permease subunit
MHGHSVLMAISVLFGFLFAGTTLIPPLLIRRLMIWLTEGGGATRELWSISLLLIGVTTIAHADRIIVLDKGRIVEIGTHEQLLSRKGHYARMVQAQDLTRSWQFRFEAPAPIAGKHQLKI